MHDTTLTAALDDKEAAGEIVEWINAQYENEETNRDMRNALRTFGKVIVNEDPTHKDAAPPDSMSWIPSTTSDTYDPKPNPANMITWDETKAMCDQPETNARDAALIALARDAGPRSGELEELTIGDVMDHQWGKQIRIENGKTGTRDVTISNAVPYIQQWLNHHPAPDDDSASLWSKLKNPDPISYRMYRDIFSEAADRVGLNKPDTPTNFRKSSASQLASKGLSQAMLEKRYGWGRESDAAARYIRIFGEDSDRKLAEARGMDVDIEEPEPTGPQPCIRCSSLVDRKDDYCYQCGMVQNREAFAEMIEKGPSMEDLMEEALHEKMAEWINATRGEDAPDLDPAEFGQVLSKSR